MILHCGLAKNVESSNFLTGRYSKEETAGSAFSGIEERCIVKKLYRVSKGMACAKHHDVSVHASALSGP